MCPLRTLLLALCLSLPSSLPAEAQGLQLFEGHDGEDFRAYGDQIRPIIRQRLVPPDAAWTAPVHPLPLYFALAALGITAVTAWLLPRRRWDGQVACTGLFLFGLTSFGLEFLRAGYVRRPVWLGWPVLAWAALGLAVAGAVGLILGARLPRRRSADVAFGTT